MDLSFRKYCGAALLSLALLLASGISALAAESHTVTLSHGAVVNGTSLAPGQYEIRWERHSPEATIQFVRHHKVVLSTEGRVEQRDKSYDYNMVVYNSTSNGTLSLSEIRFWGSSQVLVFNQ